MNVKKIILLIFVILAIVIAIIILFKNYFPKNQVAQCLEKKYSLDLTLQSGEKGTLIIPSNACDINIKNSSDLIFEVLEDNSIKDSIYQSRLYIWLRNNEDIEKQISKIAKDILNDSSCNVKPSEYLQRDGLKTHSLVGDNCWLFGKGSDYASEYFVETNGLLILHRQNGADGIAPFDFSKIKFKKN